jgi:hypothetical protein
MDAVKYDIQSWQEVALIDLDLSDAFNETCDKALDIIHGYHIDDSIFDNVQVLDRDGNIVGFENNDKMMIIGFKNFASMATNMALAAELGSIGLRFLEYMDGLVFMYVEIDQSS